MSEVKNTSEYQRRQIVAQTSGNSSLKPKGSQLHYLPLQGIRGRDRIQTCTNFFGKNLLKEKTFALGFEKENTEK